MVKVESDPIIEAPLSEEGGCLEYREPQKQLEEPARTSSMPDTVMRAEVVIIDQTDDLGSTRTTPKSTSRRKASYTEGSELSSVDTYLEAIGRYPLLDKDQERELALKIREAKSAKTQLEEQTRISAKTKNALDLVIAEGLEARQTFIESNLRLVVSIAKTFARKCRSVPILDFIQHGNVGLEHAVNKFDAEKGFKFSTYATFWIKQAMQKARASEEHTIRIPSKTIDQLGRLSYEETILIETPESDELSQAELDETLRERLGLSVERFRELKSATQVQPVSLNQTIGNSDDAVELIEVVRDQRGTEDSDAEEEELNLEIALKICANNLTTREMYVFTHIIGLTEDGEAQTKEQIAEELGIAKTAVGKTWSLANMKLARALIIENLDRNYELEPPEIVALEIYFMGRYPNLRQLKEKTPADFGSEKSFEEIHILVCEIMERVFGRAKIESVIREICEIHEFEPGKKEFILMMERFGLLGEDTKAAQIGTRSRINNILRLNSLETEILRSLVGNTDQLGDR